LPVPARWRGGNWISPRRSSFNNNVRAAMQGGGLGCR
jgi:hypothetical protein